MAAVANNPAFAKKAGIPQNVGSDFLAADKGRKFAKGGDMAESKAFEKKEMNFFKKKGAPKSLMKGEAADEGMKKGGCVKMAKGGAVKDIGGKNAIGTSAKIPKPANANMPPKSRSDLPGGKYFKPTVGEGIEKNYKANTQFVKHKNGDGIIQRGFSKKISGSKEI